MRDLLILILRNISLRPGKQSNYPRRPETWSVRSRFRDKDLGQEGLLGLCGSLQAGERPPAEQSGPSLAGRQPQPWRQSLGQVQAVFHSEEQRESGQSGESESHYTLQLLSAGFRKISLKPAKPGFLLIVRQKEKQTQRCQRASLILIFLSSHLTVSPFSLELQALFVIVICIFTVFEFYLL